MHARRPRRPLRRRPGTRSTLGLAARRARRVPAGRAHREASTCCSASATRATREGAQPALGEARSSARSSGSAKRYPWMREYLTWNEVNHCSQPTCNNPKRAAEYYLVAAQALPRLHGSSPPTCSTARRSPRGPGASRRRPASRKLIWGLHNYIDANRFRTRGTKALLKAVKGDVWFTETGGLVMRRNGSTVTFPGSIAPRGEGDVLRLPPRRALAARQARVLLPLVPGADAEADVGFRARRRRRPSPARLRACCAQWLDKHGIWALMRVRRRRSRGTSHPCSCSRSSRAAARRPRAGSPAAAR